METEPTKAYGCCKSSSDREVSSDKCRCYKNRKISNKQPNFVSQGARKTNEAQKLPEGRK